MYKLIALDLDGTLLRNDKTVSENNIEMIKKAREKGVKVVLCTGRPIDGVKWLIDLLDLKNEDDYTVCYNGAIVKNNTSEDIIFDQPLRMNDFKELYKLSKELKVNIHALTNEAVVTPKNSKYTKLEAELNGITIKEIPIDKLAENTNIIKVMYVDEPEYLKEIIKKVKDKGLGEKYTLVQSAPFFFEFLKYGINKWTAVKVLGEELGIKEEEIICVGDAGNDYHMIKNAGLGVAMENGFKELKEIADYITATNEEDGVGKVIEKFVLNK